MPLPVPEGQFLCLVCEADSNPPATLSWSQDGKALGPSQLSVPGVMELPHVGAADGGEFTCWAQHPLGSQNISLSLSVQSELRDRCWWRAPWSGVGATGGSGTWGHYFTCLSSSSGSPSSCRCVPEKQQGSWPLVLTMIRGALLGAGYLLTYGLTWIYCSR